MVIPSPGLFWQPQTIPESQWNLSALGTRREEIEAGTRSKLLLRIIVFYLTTMTFQPWDGQTHMAALPGIGNLFCKHFLTASQSLNINLPVIDGKNNRQLKKCYKADFLLPLLSPPFSFRRRLELDVRQWDPELCGILSWGLP